MVGRKGVILLASVISAVAQESVRVYDSPDCKASTAIPQSLDTLTCYQDTGLFSKNERWHARCTSNNKASILTFLRGTKTFLGLQCQTPCENVDFVLGTCDPKGEDLIDINSNRCYQVNKKSIAVFCGADTTLVNPPEDDDADADTDAGVADPPEATKDKKSSKLSGGAIAGIAVGVVVLVAGVIYVVVSKSQQSGVGHTLLQ